MRSLISASDGVHDFLGAEISGACAFCAIATFSARWLVNPGGTLIYFDGLCCSHCLTLPTVRPNRRSDNRVRGIPSPRASSRFSKSLDKVVAALVCSSSRTAQSGKSEARLTLAVFLGDSFHPHARSRGTERRNACTMIKMRPTWQTSPIRSGYVDSGRVRLAPNPRSDRKCGPCDSEISLPGDHTSDDRAELIFW